MTAASPIIQGWCPGALRPMASGDGLVVRVRPRGGRLTSEQAAKIAQLAAVHGNGLIDLSSRANVQLRGVTESSHATLIDGLRTLGLIDASAEAEGRRNIVVTPFWHDGDGTQNLAAELTAALAAPDAPQLPGKFGFVLDTASAPVLRDVSADIWLETGPNGLLLCAQGAAFGKPVKPETAVAEAIALAHWFMNQGGVTAGRGRMAALLKRVALPPEHTEPRAAALPQPVVGPVSAGSLVAFEFGQMRAETLAALAKSGPLRVTPWRMLLVEGALPHIPGLITDATDPLLRVIACTGAPGCVQALQPTRALARALAPYVPQGAVLHVSGCAKGCAHPTPVQTLTATAQGFDLIHHGTAAAAPDTIGLSAETLLTLFSNRDA